MRKRILKNTIIISALFVSSINFAFAAPSISSTSGTFAHGQSVTINGSGFGIKNTAAPWQWDNFESGTVGQRLTTQGYAEYDGTGAGTFPVYSMTKAYGQGTKSVYHPLVAGVEDFRDAGKAGLNSLEMYYSVMVYWENPSGVQSGNPVIKLVRANSTTPSGSACFYNSTAGTGCRPHFYITMRTNGGADDGGLDTGYTFNNTQLADANEIGFGSYNGYVNLNKDNWHRVEVYMKLSNPVGTANGAFESWLDGVQEYNVTNTITRDSDLAGKNLDSFMLPVMVSENAMNLNFYADDVYVDKTISRVEICSGSTWDARGKCEVQVPSAWSSEGTSITAAINQGAFTESSNQYLYVVDSTNTANEAGYQITFGSDVIAPTSPSGLSVN